MDVKQMLSNTAPVTSATMKQAAIDRIGRILDEASATPESRAHFVAVVRSQIGREERQLFTYGHVAYRARRGDVNAIALIEEFIRQERGEDSISEEEVSDEQFEALWKAGVSIGRVLSTDCSKLSGWYNGYGRDGARPYSSVVHWAKALRVCREMGLESVVFTLEHLLQVYYERYIYKADSDDITTEEGLVAIYQSYHPGFAEALRGVATMA